MTEPKPCPFCGQTGKIWRGKDCGPEFAGMDAITHDPSRKCPAAGMHNLNKWNTRT